MKVLVAVADHEYGNLIAEFVGKHKWDDGTHIKVLHVRQVEPRGMVPGPFYSDLAPADVERFERQAEKLLADISGAIRSLLGPTGVFLETESRPGLPKDEILDIALNWPADMVIMGSHGRTGISRFMLGSVSHSVMTHLPCSLTIIRQPPLKKA
jgi:nucleotide-binding universal stress UspA family protein